MNRKLLISLFVLNSTITIILSYDVRLVQSGADIDYIYGIVILLVFLLLLVWTLAEVDYKIATILKVITTYSFILLQFFVFILMLYVFIIKNGTTSSVLCEFWNIKVVKIHFSDIEISNLITYFARKYGISDMVTSNIIEDIYTLNDGKLNPEVIEEYMFTLRSSYSFWSFFFVEISTVGILFFAYKIFHMLFLLI